MKEVTDYRLVRFGERLRARRREKELTQTALMTKLYGESYEPGSNEKKLRFWEKGQYSPDVSKLLDLCDALDCDADYLLGKIDAPRHTIQELSDLTGLSFSFIEKLISDKRRCDNPTSTLEDILLHQNLLYGIFYNKPYLELLEKLYSNTSLLNAILAYIHTDTISTISIGDNEIDISSTDDVLIDGFPINSQLVKQSYIDQIIDELNQLSKNINKPE